jgi:hypothetical protein
MEDPVDGDAGAGDDEEGGVDPVVDGVWIGS